MPTTMNDARFDFSYSGFYSASCLQILLQSISAYMVAGFYLNIVGSNAKRYFHGLIIT